MIMDEFYRFARAAMGMGFVLGIAGLLVVAVIGLGKLFVFNSLVGCFALLLFLTFMIYFFMWSEDL